MKSVYKICPNCKKGFKTYASHNKRCCSAECAKELRTRERYEKYKCICKVCGIAFLPPRPSEGGYYCSYKCRGIATRKVRIQRMGYWRVCKPEHPAATKQGYVAEHRLIMEQAIGRLLRDDEEVHHLNRDGLDNRLENLQLMTISEHRTMHALDSHRLGKFNTPEIRDKNRARMKTNNPHIYNDRGPNGRYVSGKAGRRVDE